jgi:protein-tyrosine phosphatase
MKEKNIAAAQRVVRVLFICMGNICRSPTAEGVFKRYVREAGLEHAIWSDSAGTHDYHIGEPPDRRAREAARRRGYDLEDLRARRVAIVDFADFDLLLAMDQQNVQMLERLCPEEHRHKLRLFLDFGRQPHVREVPDPYYGGVRGFETVLDLIEDAAQGLLRHIQTELLD